MKIIYQRNKKHFLVFFLVVSLVFSPINFSFFVNVSPVSAIDLVITKDTEWSELQIISGYVTVEKGVTLTIKKGTAVKFEGQSGLDIQGNLNVEGTPSDPVFFQKRNASNSDDYYSMSVSGKVYARNIDVSGGGRVFEVFQVERNRRDTPLQYANAMWLYSGAFTTYSAGSLDIENANFHNNALPIYTPQFSIFGTKIWRSKFIQNDFDIINGGSTLDAQYNWWDNINGPVMCTVDCGDSHPRQYQKIIGTINFSHFTKERDFRDPVVIIPGIMGSWKMTQANGFELDPVMGTYDDLLETLKKDGYTDNKNIFLFPYDWRMSNVETAKLLRTKIEEIKAQTEWPKVDIIAHSMGGLVAREYIGTLNGGGSIDQLITLGAPHNGSPKSYLMWDGGEFSSPSRFSIFDSIANKVFKQEAEENGYATVFDYIRRAPVSSVRELLPVYDYLRDQASNTLRVYPNFYPTNTFLQNLKTLPNLSRLEKVDFTNIVGKMNGNDTISTVRVGGPSIELLDNLEKIVLWGHGEPDGYDNFLGDHGLEIGNGDGTVPLWSATNILADETIELKSSHSNLPKNASEKIVTILTNTNITPVSLPLPKSYLLVMPFSPIDIQIIAPDGSRIGKDFTTGKIYDEIPGAYYTGYDTKNEFITIPNPEQGEYKILTQGTDTGAYRVEVSHIQEDESGIASESTATITGTSELAKESEASVEIQKTGEIVLKNQDMLPSITTLASAGTRGTGDWYTGDVTITLSAKDDENGSGIEKTEYSLDNGLTWNIYTSPIILSNEGITRVKYFSTDNVGNKEEMKTQEIKIDKTAPEAKIIFNSDTQKIDIIGIDNLGGPVSVATRDLSSKVRQKKSGKKNDTEEKRGEEGRTKMTVTLRDEAGHTTVLFFQKEKDEQDNGHLKWLSVVYDGTMIALHDTVIEYRWRLNRIGGLYESFSASLKTDASSFFSRYMPKQNETWILDTSRERDDEKNDQDEETDKLLVKEKLSGMIIPWMTTEKGIIKINK
ncbi:MAG: hypothetical protein COZ86_04390 [Candidatus Moranbacteria bacterium CG_4_8_14_3_um_filter_41_13]|nr:MAG: hypothetical protein COZ86_04390 [Candidatus Moranbacteria bacterium CG_4_8_14_3_um_filter_41_13]